MRFFAEISYLGTGYCGWQRQPDAPSVQGVIEDALGKLLRERITVTGAGRTDTGVHAAHYIAHFDAPKEPDIYHLNAILPHDVAVHRVWPTTDDAHARFDAREREYKYFIALEKNPFRQHLTWQYRRPLDIDPMNLAAAYLIGTQDFSTFSKLHSSNKTFICTVLEAQWIQVDQELVFTIRADRFLRNMVRAIVGTLVDVGNEKITPERFGELLAARDRALSSGSAPPQGLIFNGVKY